METKADDKLDTPLKSRQATLSRSFTSGVLSYSFDNSIEPTATASTNYLDEYSGTLNKIEISRGQRRLHDLKGVVVIEKIEGYVQKLQDPRISIDEKIQIITQLQEKSPSTKIIESTGIGRLIRNIAKNAPDQENEQSIELIKVAKKLYRHWKRLVDKRVDQNLVKTMTNLNDTERKNHVRLLQEACKACIDKDSNCKEKSSFSASSTIANRIERYIFNLTGKFIGTYYRRLMKKVIFDLRDNNLGLFQKIFIFKGRLLMVDTGYDKISKGARVDDILKEHLSELILESS